MKTKIRLLILTILVSTFSTFANSWKVYPWTLNTSNNIKIMSIPYRIYEGGDLGITKVYKQKVLLYSIDEYFSNFITIDKSGEYFVSIDFRLYRNGYDIIETDQSGHLIPKIEEFEGEAIKIFKHGKLVKTINFSELKIDTSKLIKNYDTFSWMSNNKQVMVCPAIIEGDILKIVSIDQQILKINLHTGEQLYSEKVETDKIDGFVKLRPKRKFEVIKNEFPKKHLLPKLIDSKTIEEGISKILKLKSAENRRDSVLVEIYFHTLLINREGICEKCYVSCTKREVPVKEFQNDYELEKKIEDWIYKQRFDTGLIPKYTEKYVFSDFIYLK